MAELGPSGRREHLFSGARPSPGAAKPRMVPRVGFLRHLSWFGRPAPGDGRAPL